MTAAERLAAAVEAAQAGDREFQAVTVTTSRSRLMKRADLAKNRFVIGCAMRAAMWYHPSDRPAMGDDERIDLAMGGVIHDAMNGCGGGIGPATVKAAHRNWDAWRAEVVAAYPRCLEIETGNRRNR